MERTADDHLCNGFYERSGPGTWGRPLGHYEHRYDPGSHSFTASLWYRQPPGGEDGFLIGRGLNGNNGNTAGWTIDIAGTDLRFAITGRDRLSPGGTVQATFSTGTLFTDNNWHHIAMVIDRDANQLRGYLDGALQTTIAIPADLGPVVEGKNLFTYNGSTGFAIGRNGAGVDDVLIAHRAYTDAEIADLNNLIMGAVNPSPGIAEKVDVTAVVSLSWGVPNGMAALLSATADNYQVYIGSNSAAVEAATTASPEYLGSTNASNFAITALTAQPAYFWRVDTVLDSGRVLTGDVWSMIHQP